MNSAGGGVASLYNITLLSNPTIYNPPIGMLDLQQVDKLTLFLDRDGVINHEKKESYISIRDEFKFL